MQGRMERETLDEELGRLEAEDRGRWAEVMAELQEQAEELLEGKGSPLLGRLVEEYRQEAMRKAISRTASNEETWMARGTAETLEKIVDWLIVLKGRWTGEDESDATTEGGRE